MCGDVWGFGTDVCQPIFKLLSLLKLRLNPSPFLRPRPASSLSHKQVLEYLDEQMPPETPLAFGMHPNAEIGFKLREAETFCNSLVQLQPREAGGEGGMSMEEKAKMVLDDLVSAMTKASLMKNICSFV